MALDIPKIYRVISQFINMTTYEKREGEAVALCPTWAYP